MNANLKNSETPVVAVGQIDGETFQAELFPQAQIVLCYSPSPDNILSIVDTERQTNPIAVRLLTQHWLFIPLTHWLFVEVQSCFGKVRARKVAGLRIRNGGRSAHYEDLSPQESHLLKPRLKRFQTRLNASKKTQQEAFQHSSSLEPKG
jgi:hypothetical protein